MMVVRFMIFLLIKEITGNCSFSRKMLKKRSHYQHMVQLEGSLNYIFDYEFLWEPKRTTPHDFLKILKKTRIFFHDPITFLEFHDENTFQYKIHTNLSNAFQTVSEYKSKKIKMNLNFLKTEKCASDMKSVAWEIKNDDPFSLLMLACHVNSSESGFDVSKMLIILTDNFCNLHNFTENSKNFQFKGKKLKFKNYYDNRFCFCHSLDSFYNECRVEKNEVKFQVFLVIFAFIILAYVLFEILNCINKKINSMRNNQIFP